MKLSKKERKRRLLASKVMTEAHRIYRCGTKWFYSFSICLKLAWKFVRNLCKFTKTNVRGVSFDNLNGISRQDVLKALSKYKSDQIALSFKKEQDNHYDPFAVKVIAKVMDKGSAQIGYLPRGLAKSVSQSLDSGKEVMVILKEITGGGLNYHGLNLKFVIL